MRTAKWAALAAMAIAMISPAWSGETAIPNRLARAKVGEWVLYRMPSDYTQKQTVVKIEGSGPEAKVTIHVEHIYGGEVTQSADVVETVGEPVAPAPRGDAARRVSVRNETVTVKGRSIPAVVVEVREGNETASWHFSDEIPVHGLVKSSDGKGEPAFEAIDYGEE